MQQHAVGEIAFLKVHTHKGRKCFAAVSHFNNICSLCSKTVKIFSDYYSMLEVDSLGSKSGVLAFGS
jgi:hypothetical protein